MHIHMMSDESHYMQAKCGRLEEFEVRLQFLRGENADISQGAADIIVISFLFKLHEGAANIENK